MTVICWVAAFDGVEKPAGVEIFRFVVPAPMGWKTAKSEESPALKVMGEVMVPTAGVELTMLMVGEPTPGASCAEPRTFSVPGERMTGWARMFAVGEKVVVVKLPLAKVNPEGSMVTATVELAKPGAEMVMDVVPMEWPWM